ncbi:MAG TPA: ABC transporter permease, partial [Mycobacteriales bacterium]|nr:ABC transporter permease [Mycobacteriales bacterium]
NVVVLWLPVVAVLVVLVTAFTLGLALALSVANVYFRDVQHFVGIFLQMWFYATPVVYPISLVEAQRDTEILGVSVLTLYELNPAVQFVEAFRDVLYDLVWPSPGRWLTLLAWSVGSLVVGVLVFRRAEGNLAEEL